MHDSDSDDDVVEVTELQPSVARWQTQLASNRPSAAFKSPASSRPPRVSPLTSSVSAAPQPRPVQSTAAANTVTTSASGSTASAVSCPTALRTHAPSQTAAHKHTDSRPPPPLRPLEPPPPPPPSADRIASILSRRRQRVSEPLKTQSLTNSPHQWLFDRDARSTQPLFTSHAVRGSGTRPFHWINTVDDTTPFTLPYRHQSHNTIHQSAAHYYHSTLDSVDNRDCCHCDEATGCTDNCGCSRFGQIRHGTDGLMCDEEGEVLGRQGVIVECNAHCTCSTWATRQPCQNRVVQSASVNPAYSLLVYRTVDTGWGVATLSPIPPHHYICEYVGEVISDTLADTRTSSRYLFNLQHSVVTGDRWQLTGDFEPPCIDAERVGGVARFINHCCVPAANCSAYPVYCDGREVCRFRIAVFSGQCRIEAGEQLTYDYGDGEEEVVRMFDGACRCQVCAARQGGGGGRKRSAMRNSD